MRAALKRSSRKIADEEALKQARQTTALSRKHAPSPVAAHDDNAAALISGDAGTVPSAAAKLGAEDAAQPGVSSADDGGSQIEEHPEEVALEHKIVTLLQERQAKANSVQESREHVAPCRRNWTALSTTTSRSSLSQAGMVGGHRSSASWSCHAQLRIGGQTDTIFV
jgi:hypothetical protein